MNSTLAVIQEKAQLLSPQRQSQLIDFAEFLLSKESVAASAPVGEPAFDWMDEEVPEPVTSSSRGLAFDWVVDDDGPSEELTSVEMQHQATQWMFEMAEKNLAQP